VVTQLAPDAGTLPKNADGPQFGFPNLVGSRLNNADYEGDFELGGYVPLGGLRHRLFFFGTFNPSFNNEYFAPAINSGLYQIYNGLMNRDTTSLGLRWQVDVQDQQFPLRLNPPFRQIRPAPTRRRCQPHGE